MPEVRWVLSYGFCSNFYFENRLRFDKVTESLKVGTFLRHSVYTKLFSISSGVRCCIVCNETALKITTNFSDDVHFLHAFYLKSTINANFVCIPVEATFSTSIVCPNHYSQYFFNENGISLSLLCPDTDPS